MGSKTTCFRMIPGYHALVPGKPDVFFLGLFDGYLPKNEYI